MRCIERVLQGCLNKIQSWADCNGFRFSKSKSVSVHFCNKHTPHPDPSLKLYNVEIPVVSECKFLGIIFDNKLSFKPHIAHLRNKCLSAMNLLRVVAHTDWGADSATLLRLYRSLVRSKLDYGCIVYGSAFNSHLQALDRVQNAALRLCLGAYRTTPISSLHVEANELPLSLRREKLALNYIIKLKSNPDNPAFESVFAPNYIVLFDSKPHVIPPLGLRLHHSLSECGVDLRCIANQSLPSTPPWLLHPPRFDYTLYNIGTKSNTSPELYLSFYREMLSTYEGYLKLYTDGSKKDRAVAAAAVTEHTIRVKRLPNNASIFSAEARAILLALDIIKQSTNRQFLILSDSLSCLQAIENRNLQNPLIVNILESLHQQLTQDSKLVTFVWVPSHIGIPGNDLADATAKSALRLSASASVVPHTDFKPLILTHVNSCWQHSWNQDTNNKLHNIQPLIKPFVLKRLPRRDEVIIHRLRVGHTHLTHSYLLKKENPPECEFCHLLLTVDHMLIACSNHNTVRHQFFQATSLAELFERVNARAIVDFVKKIGLYLKL